MIVATGPLTSPALAERIRALTGEDALAFFDAIAPIVHRDSIDMSVAWFQSRYDKAGPGGTGADYINCPMTREQYDAFVDALLAGDKVSFHEWEDTPYFDGCLPIEVMAERGRETLRHGPMKPVGLTNPHDPQTKAYAVVQLRQDNKLGTLYNMVGFQTKLKHGAQQRVFRTIPGLENAEFARLGGLHRNTFLNSPKLLDGTLRLAAMPRLRFAGQITGCEGYVESAAIGLLAGRFAAAERRGEAIVLPPPTTAHGALLGHITGGHIETIDAGPRSFQPMNVNFGLFPPHHGRAQGGRRQAAARAEKTTAKKRTIWRERSPISIAGSEAGRWQRCGKNQRNFPTPSARGPRHPRLSFYWRRHCGRGLDRILRKAALTTSAARCARAPIGAAIAGSTSKRRGRQVGRSRGKPPAPGARMAPAVDNFRNAFAAPPAQRGNARCGVSRPAYTSSGYAP